jgi:hypothetical protein
MISSNGVVDNVGVGDVLGSLEEACVDADTRGEVVVLFRDEQSTAAFVCAAL